MSQSFDVASDAIAVVQVCQFAGAERSKKSRSASIATRQAVTCRTRFDEHCFLTGE